MILHRNQQVLLLEGQRYTPDECREIAARYRLQTETSSHLPLAATKHLQIESTNCLSPAADKHLSPILRDLFIFLADWFDESPTLTVHTSGSTGTPKPLVVRKDQMMQSARFTCRFLDLHPGDNALLCMPMAYIAGKMMVVRALVAGLNLWVRTPSGHPLADALPSADSLPAAGETVADTSSAEGILAAAPEASFRFSAMIPLQVYNTLRVPQERQRLEQIDTLIIGGGAIDASLEAELRSLPGEVYSTYGMTETLSHIALRRLNGPEVSQHYHPFESVRLSLSADDTLVINAPLVCEEELTTNDVARLHADGSFTILGRRDNIVNTGGIKVQIEQVESQLRPYLSVPFAITSVPDARLGEAIVLLLQSDGTSQPAAAPAKEETLCEPSTKSLPKPVSESLNEPAPDSFPYPFLEVLPKYHRPRHIFRVPAIPMTGSGKIDRAACKIVAQKLVH